MSKKKKEKNPFIEAFEKLPKDHTPQQVEQIIKEILRANGLSVENVSITTKQNTKGNTLKILKHQP